MRRAIVLFTALACLAACDKTPAPVASTPVAVSSSATPAAPPAPPKPLDPGVKLVTQWDAGQPEIPSNLVAVALWDEGYKATLATGPSGWVGCSGLEDMVWKAAKASSIEGIKQVGFFGYHMTMSGCPLPDEAKLREQIGRSISVSMARNKQAVPSSKDLELAATAIINQAKTGVSIDPIQPTRGVTLAAGTVGPDGLRHPTLKERVDAGIARGEITVVSGPAKPAPKKP